MPNFYNRFLESVQRWPDNIALEMQHQDPGTPLERYTYSELRRMADAVAHWLTQHVARGDRCAILAHNGPRWVSSYLGTMAAGCVAVPFDIAFNAAQVHKLLANSGATLLFADSKYLAVAREAAKDLDVRLVSLDATDAPDIVAHLDAIFAEHGASSSPGDPRPFTPVELDDTETAAILYTSGTTSDPKGVMLTHANFAAESKAVFQLIPVGPSDAILGILPLFHALAQMANLLLPFAAGARVVFLDSLNTSELLRALQERDITLFCCVPQFFYLIHERILREVGTRGSAARLVFNWMLSVARIGRRLGLNPGKLFFRSVHQKLGPRMRYLVTGGSKLDPAIGRDFQTLGFELLQAYGLTETSGGAFCTRPNHNVIGSVGPPLRGMEAKIANPQATEDAPLPVGEIAIRGPIVMKGYYNRPDATAEVIRDGWLHTGDLGYIDSHGDLFITGRAKEIIVLSSGKNIYPDEIEAHYLKNPYVKEICVMGLQARPGEPASERLHAVVVPNFDVLRQRKIVNAREIVRFELESLSASLPATKRILSYDIWQEDLPRTTTRKLKRFAIQKMVEGRLAAGADSGSGEVTARPLSDEERQWIELPDVARALAILRQASKNKKDELRPDDNLELDLGLDSMERVELLVSLEQELGAHVDDSVAAEVYTVRDLVDTLRANVGATGRRHEHAAWDTILQTEPTDPAVLAVTQDRPLSSGAWYVAGRLLQLFSRDFFKLRVTGLDKLPRNGPFILSPNHQSFLEAPIIISCLPYRLMRDLFYVGTSEIFGEGILRRLAGSVKLIPVDPDANLIPAMRAGAYGLRHNMILVLFPEGERSIDGVPRVFKKGASILSTHLQVPIVPCAVSGFYQVWPRGVGFQGFKPVQIAFGDPIYPPKNPPSPESAYEQVNAKLRGSVVGMWEELEERAGRRQPPSLVAAAD